LGTTYYKKSLSIGNENSEKAIGGGVKPTSTQRTTIGTCGRSWAGVAIRHPTVGEGLRIPGTRHTKKKTKEDEREGKEKLVSSFSNSQDPN
jgi:hypothetical protein